MTARVTGIGGIFFKARDPEGLRVGIAITLAYCLLTGAEQYSSQR